MKKIFSVLCMFLSVNMIAETNVATFENEVGGVNVAKADTVWQGADVPALGWNNWTSGTFGFQTYYDNTYGPYFSAFTVSNQTDSTYTGIQDAYHSASAEARSVSGPRPAIQVRKGASSSKYARVISRL